MDYLTNSASLLIKPPAITATLEGKKNRALNLLSVTSIEESTRSDLSTTLKELGLVNGQNWQLLVSHHRLYYSHFILLLQDDKSAQKY